MIYMQILCFEQFQIPCIHSNNKKFAWWIIPIEYDYSCTAFLNILLKFFTRACNNSNIKHLICVQVMQYNGIIFWRPKVIYHVTISFSKHINTSCMITIHTLRVCPCVDIYFYILSHFTFFLVDKKNTI